MTDETETRPMDDTRNEHPDEGTIHAWLDGALDEPTATRIAAHVATCGECAERVAEARGLIAGASRVVRALDDSTTSADPTWGQVTASIAANRPASRSIWRALRVTPLRSAIAATVLVALGVTFTSRRTAVETEAPRTMSTAAEGAAGESVALGLPTRDALFDSAIARNVAEAQPPRAVGAAPTPAVPAPAPSRGGASGMADPAAARRVAAGRGALQEQRDSGAGIAADQLASRSAGKSSRAVVGAMAAASARGDSASRVLGSTVASTRVDVAVATSASAAAEAPAQIRRRIIPGSRECYRVERASAGAGAWGPVSLPFVIAINADGRSARVMTADGGSTDATATLTRGASDSLFLRLTRVGYEGTLDVGAVGPVRAGVMRSAPVRTGEEVVAMSGASAREERSARTNPRAPGRQTAPSATVSAPLSKQNDAIIMPATSIVARLITCPG